MNQNKDIGRAFCTEFASMIKDLQESEFDLSEWKESVKRTQLSPKVKMYKCCFIVMMFL